MVYMSYEKPAWIKALCISCVFTFFAPQPANAALNPDGTTYLKSHNLKIGSPSLAWVVHLNKIKEKFKRDAKEILQATLRNSLLFKFEKQTNYREAQKISILLFDIFDIITFAYQQSATLAYINAGKARSLSDIDLKVYKNFLYNFIILQINSRLHTISYLMANLIHKAQAKDMKELTEALAILRASLTRNIYASNNNMDTEFQKMLALSTLLNLYKIANSAKSVKEIVDKLEENQQFIDQIAKRW